MINFNKNQTGNIMLALITLELENYIDGYKIYSDFASVDFDDYSIRITVPVKNALQFSLLHSSQGDKLIQSLVTESAQRALPIRRIILSLFGVIQLQSFSKEWDGFTIHENFGE